MLTRIMLQDHHDGGHSWNQTGCDRTGGEKLRLLEIGRVARAKGPDQPGQIGTTLSPIVGYDEPGGRTGDARFSEEIAQGMKELCECLEATGVGGPAPGTRCETTSRVRQVMKLKQGHASSAVTRRAAKKALLSLFEPSTGGHSQGQGWQAATSSAKW